MNTLLAGMDSESVSSTHSTSDPPPCIDKLREEFSCAICLNVFFEPTTTSCGHSFCRKCLRSSIDKFRRRCPICRQWMRSKGGSCTVSTVLWNTIQLLFPQDVAARKETDALNSPEEAHDLILERDNPSAQPNGDMEISGENRHRVDLIHGFRDLNELRAEIDEVRRDVDQQRALLRRLLREPPAPPSSPS